jgi:hypothetical protein
MTFARSSSGIVVAVKDAWERLAAGRLTTDACGGSPVTVGHHSPVAGSQLAIMIAASASMPYAKF